MAKLFSEKKDIESWLKKYKVKDYILISGPIYGYVVDVNSDVILENYNLDFIPLKFNNIAGDFSCVYNRLKNLEFAPKIVGKNFHCSYNRLKNLKGGPQQVGESYICTNQSPGLRSLEGAPLIIPKSFHCFHNRLISLEFAPKWVGQSFACSSNQIKNLINCPQIEGVVDFSNNQIQSLKGIQEEIKETFFCSDNQLTSLEFAPKKIQQSFYCQNNCLSGLKNGPAYVGLNYNCENNNLSELEEIPIYVGNKISLQKNPLLGVVQEISSFEELRMAYECAQIKREKRQIENKINKSTQSTSKTILKV